jgi:hypothetical protein
VEVVELPISPAVGIANDGAYLYVTTGTHHIYALDPTGFYILRKLVASQGRAKIG